MNNKIQRGTRLEIGKAHKEGTKITLWEQNKGIQKDTI
jgi:hypothetical protein